MIINNRIRHQIFIITTFILYVVLTIVSCSPKQDKKEIGYNKNPQEKHSHNKHLNKFINVRYLAITDNDTSGKYSITSTYYDERKSLPFLKKPDSGITAIEQILTSKSAVNKSDKIYILIFKFDTYEKAKIETKINFELLKNILKKDEHGIESFSVNTIGDESISIILSNANTPNYLYCRRDNILIKLNSEKNIPMDELVNLLKEIDDKLK